MKIKTVFKLVEGFFAVIGMLASAIAIHKTVMCFNCYGTGTQHHHENNSHYGSNVETPCNICNGRGFINKEL